MEAESGAVVSDDGQNAVAGGGGVVLSGRSFHRWRASKESFCCAVESSAALSPVKEMVAMPEETATE